MSKVPEQDKPSPILDHAKARRVSGLTVRAYCGQANISESVYYYRQKQLSRRHAETSLGGPALRPSSLIEIGLGRLRQASYSIRFDPGSAELIIPAGFASFEVGQLIELVRAVTGTRAC